MRLTMHVVKKRDGSYEHMAIRNDGVDVYRAVHGNKDLDYRMITVVANGLRDVGNTVEPAEGFTADIKALGLN